MIRQPSLSASRYAHGHMIAAVALASFLFQSPTLNLYRGAAVATPKYWDMSDTYLDSGDPEGVFGGAYTLLGGKGKTILIRFGDLNRVVGPHKRIVKASLFLTPSGGDVPSLGAVGRVSASWEEGPRTVLTNLFMPPPTTKPEAPRWAANFRQRHAGYDSWQVAGALGAQDMSPIPGATLVSAGSEFAIQGLESAVQTMLDHPAENFGFELAFISSTEFLSSKSPNGRPRLELQVEDAPQVDGPDLSVTRIEKNGDSYTAHIKNVGNEPAQPFNVQWTASGRAEKPMEVTNVTPPGGETTVSFTDAAAPSHTDHRVHPLTARILPAGPDACSANNELTIDTDAFPVDVTIPPDVAQRLKTTNYLGSTSVEDWVQAQVELWNDSYADKSRFSFAPDGALERIRVNSIQIGQSGSLSVDESADPLSASLPFLKQLGYAVGLLDGGPMEVSRGSVQVAGSTSRQSADLYPGLMGYGDTRFEGAMPGAIPLVFDPVSDPVQDEQYLEPTDLLAGNDVAALNAHLEAKPSKRSDDLLPIKKAVILQILDLSGKPVPSADLLFFQSVNGKFPGGDPTFAVRTNDSGIAVLNARGSAGPFGDLDANAGNSVFLIQAKANGVLATGWLKAWQLNEEAIRNATTVPIYLNLPEAPIETETNLATDRLITDSAQDLPAKLAPLIDDSDDTTAALPAVKDAWVEVDLGRDRTIGEIDLVTKGDPFWNKFDVMVYGTGQQLSDAFPWARELDWKWTVANRSDASKSGTTVAYRGSNQRVRYLRFVNRSGEAGSLAEIRVYAARISQ
jgi:hypothetical protein